jgi:hypothetical protein
MRLGRVHYTKPISALHGRSRGASGLLQGARAGHESMTWAMAHGRQTPSVSVLELAAKKPEPAPSQGKCAVSGCPLCVCRRVAGIPAPSPRRVHRDSECSHCGEKGESCARGECMPTPRPISVLPWRNGGGRG